MSKNRYLGAYLREDQHRIIKQYTASLGMSVSEWIREQIDLLTFCIGYNPKTDFKQYYNKIRLLIPLEVEKDGVKEHVLIDAPGKGIYEPDVEHYIYRPASGKEYRALLNSIKVEGKPTPLFLREEKAG